jgi:hypothetical protein
MTEEILAENYAQKFNDLMYERIRVTRWDCEKLAQKIANPIFSQN